MVSPIATDMTQAEHGHNTDRSRIGEVLIELGYIDQAQLDEVLEYVWS